jgi:hypothetical protein
MSTKKSAYFYKSFIFSFPGLLSESQLAELNQYLESKATEICAVNEKFHPNDIFADVFEKLTCKTELANGKLSFQLTVKHKLSSIKFNEDLLKNIITNAVPGSVFLESMSRQRTLAEKKTTTINTTKTPSNPAEPLSPVSTTDSVYVDKPEIDTPVTVRHQHTAFKANSQPSSNLNTETKQKIEDDDDNVSISSDIYNEEYKLWKLSQKRAKIQPTPASTKTEATEEPKSESKDSFSISLNKQTVVSFFLGFVSGSIVNSK